VKVIKLGGSLAHSNVLTDCLQTVNQHYLDQGAVIVPGGGCFADQVRLAQQQWSFDDRAAHQMAVLSMQQMAVMLGALMPTWSIHSTVHECQQHFASGRMMIWSPDLTELDAAGVASSWEVTSDSLAAWLANRLSAKQLLLVKSSPIKPDMSIQQLQQTGVLDKAFHQFIGDADYSVNILHYSHL
jgi:5-(aminomethyl)-3-furanmethanol phosphate kinase